MGFARLGFAQPRRPLLEDTLFKSKTEQVNQRPGRDKERSQSTIKIKTVYLTILIHTKTGVLRVKMYSG